MMQFLRKHQKKLFIVIAIMTVGSFAFMGNGSMGHEIEDKKIGKTIDGKAIYARDIHALTQFLSMGASDILRKDLMDSGIVALIAEKHFDTIQSEFHERLQKAREATFYSHPQIPSINAVQIWNTYAPYMMKDYHALISGSLDAKTFSTYAKLYMDQQTFPPELLRTFLLYQQYTYQGIRLDHNLQDIRSLALFGYQSFEEWFGSRFTELLGKFVLNTAVVAQKKGYKVTLGEARAEFEAMCLQAIKKNDRNNALTSEQISELMRMQLQAAGVDESGAVKLWRKVMLVHRYFQDIRQGVLVDPIPYEQFTTFAEAQASIDVYTLPEEFRPKNFQSIQYYLDAISPEGKNGMPRRFYSADEIEKKHPQLITSRYELDVAKVTQDELNCRIHLKALWAYEKSPEGWAQLIATFPVLNKQDSAAEIDREKILDSCDPELRKKVDRFARLAIIKEHPEWMEEAFAQKTMENYVVHIRSQGAVAPFEEIEETLELRQLLHKTAVGETIRYTAPGAYYQIKVVTKPDHKEVMTFKEARGAIEALLDKKSDTDENRLVKWMQEAQKSVQKEGEQSIYLLKTGNRLTDQWTLVKTSQTLKRSDSTSLPKAELFSMAVGSWSTSIDAKNLSFFQLVKIDEGSQQKETLELAQKSQLLIGQEVMKSRIITVLDEVGVL